MGSMIVTTIAVAAPDKLYFLNLANTVDWNRDSLLFKFFFNCHCSFLIRS